MRVQGPANSWPSISLVEKRCIGAHDVSQPLDLYTLAEVAHFSQFHFHRLFSARMGETLGDCQRRQQRTVDLHP
jgi:AraC-like DNA-binding protein